MVGESIPQSLKLWQQLKHYLLVKVDKTGKKG
jgi:hypothetical protein